MKIFNLLVYILWSNFIFSMWIEKIPRISEFFSSNLLTPSLVDQMLKEAWVYVWIALLFYVAIAPISHFLNHKFMINLDN